MPDAHNSLVWQPLSFSQLFRNEGWKRRAFWLLVLGWAGAAVLAVLSASVDVDPTVPIPFTRDSITLSVYLPMAACELLLFLLGPEWALPPAFVATFLGVLGQGSPSVNALLIGFVDPLSIAVFALAYRALALPMDFRSRRSWVWFVAVSIFSSLFASSGSFIWSEGNHLSAHDTFSHWAGWMFGDLSCSLFLVGPILAVVLRPWLGFRDRHFPRRPSRPFTFRSLIAAIGGAGLVFASFLATTSQMAAERLGPILGRGLPPDLRAAVWDAVASWRFSAWSAIIIVVAITIGALGLAHWWSGVWENQHQVLAEATRRAQNALRVKSDFLATISHELRTPMNGILGMHELLLAGPLSEEQRRYVAIADESARHLLELLNELLDLSKIEAGKLDIREAPFDIRHQVSLAASLMRPRAEAAGLALSVSVEASVPAALVGDADRIRQILLNLLGNAIKFTGKGSVSIAVAVRSLSPARAVIEISVADTGSGIAPEVLPRLFRPFSQGDVSLSRSYGGTGLGLSICKQLTELMGGEIWVESELGRGSVFTFRLPMRIPAPEQAPAPVAQSPAPEPPAASAPADKTPACPLGARVLLAEDNAVNQLVATRFLQRLGCVVDVVPSGFDALERCSSNRYDVVLMDCQMPGLDGLETTRRIRRAESGSKRVPIIALTAHAGHGWRERCREAGMDGFIGKPVSFSELRQALEDHLRA